MGEYLLLIVASFVLGLFRPRLWLLLLGRIACAVVGAVGLASYHTDMAGFATALWVTAAVLASLAGLLGYGIATRRSREQEHR